MISAGILRVDFVCVCWSDWGDVGCVFVYGDVAVRGRRRG